MISATFSCGNVLLGGMQQIDANNFNFENFESTLYMKSVSMPLTKTNLFQNILQGISLHVNDGEITPMTGCRIDEVNK